jgi:integrase
LEILHCPFFVKRGLDSASEVNPTCGVTRLQGKRRTFVAQYRADGRTRRVTLGPVERLTPDQARRGARKVLARASLGEDPQGEKAARRAQAERTFAKVVEAYLAAREGELRPESRRLVRLYLEGPYFRPLHASAIGAITRADIAARLSAITRKHSKLTAHAARKTVNALFVWAMEEGLIDANPVIGTRRPGEAPARDRVLADAELVAIWNACDRGGDFDRIVRLLILTGARRREIGGMRFDEIDLDAGAWTLPAARAKNHRANTLTLPPSALAIVRAAADLRFAQRDGRQHLFGARSRFGYGAWDDGKAALDRHLAGAVKPWKLHDLRRTVATRMADIGIEPHVIEAVLNHYSGHRAGVAGVYNRSPYERAVKAALIRWSEHVRDLVEGCTGSNVVTLRG